MEYSNRENINLIEKIKEHAELIAALMAGIFILLAWRLDTGGQTTASVLLYLIAFVWVVSRKQKKVLKKR